MGQKTTCQVKAYEKTNSTVRVNTTRTLQSSVIDTTYFNNKAIKIPTAAEIVESENFKFTHEDETINTVDLITIPSGATNVIKTIKLDYLKNEKGEDLKSLIIDNEITLENLGSYTLKYYYESSYEYNILGSINYVTTKLELLYTFSVKENHYPLKKWTVLEVLNRVFDTIEPLRYGQKPRFRLQGVIYDDVTGNAIGYYGGGGNITLNSKESSAYLTVARLLKEGE